MKSKDIYSLFESTQPLFEVAMNPGSLRKKALAVPGVRIGIEFEMVIPDDDLYNAEVPDFYYDERVTSIDEAVEFFETDYNDGSALKKLREILETEYEKWKIEQIEKLWKKEGKEFYTDWVRSNVPFDEVADYVGKVDKDLFGERVPTESEWEEFIDKTFEEYESEYSNKAKDDFREIKLPLVEDEEEFLDDSSLDYTKYIYENYDDFLTWPYTETSNEPNLEGLAEDFSNYVGRPATHGQTYHSAPRQDGAYAIEPDPSISGYGAGIEFISPVLTLEEMLEDLPKIKRFADDYGASTNSSTGLHINVSIDGYSKSKLDYTKLALLLGDKYVLEKFDRAYNDYCVSAIDKVNRNISNMSVERIESLLSNIKSGVSELAGQAIHDGYTDKYTSINTKNGYIEFRGPGNDWLDDHWEQIEPTIFRNVVALEAAIDPEKYKKEYSAALYKLLAPKLEQSNNKSMLYFTEYVAGRISKSEVADRLYTNRLNRLKKKGIVVRDERDIDEGDWIVDFNGEKLYLLKTDAVDNKTKAKEAAKRVKPNWDPAAMRVSVVTFEELEGMKLFEVNGPALFGKYIVAPDAKTAINIGVRTSTEVSVMYMDRPDEYDAIEVTSGISRKNMAGRLRSQEKEMKKVKEEVADPNKIWQIQRRGIFADYDLGRIVAPDKKQALEIAMQLDPLYRYIGVDLEFYGVVTPAYAERYTSQMQKNIDYVADKNAWAIQLQKERDQLAQQTGIKMYMGFEDDNDFSWTVGKNEEEAKGIYRYITGYPAAKLIEFDYNNLGLIPHDSLMRSSAYNRIFRAATMTTEYTKQNYIDYLPHAIERGYISKPKDDSAKAEQPVDTQPASADNQKPERQKISRMLSFIANYPGAARPITLAATSVEDAIAQLKKREPNVDWNSPDVSIYHL